jgi:ABC-type branched-subunit amino acid transport system substrate-binding protein
VSPSTRPCAAASTAPGVTADTINVGAIATVSGPVPGLAGATLAAARSYVAYRNSIGGVCGRKIVLKTGDDGFENTRFRSILQDMIKSTLGLSSSFAGGDGGGVDIATAAHYPATSSAMTDQWQDAPTVFDINPLPKDPHASIGKYKYAYAQGARTASLVTIAQAQSLAQLNLQQAQMEAAGLKVVNRQELPLSTLSYDAAARSVANSKADYFIFLGAGNLNVSMTKSLRDTGYKPKFVDILTAYGSDFIQQAGDAAEGVVSWSRALPAEERNSNKELGTFLDWMSRIAPGVAPDPFAVDAWASSKAFFDSLEALPGPITRDALLAQLKTMTNYDAGGFYGPINLGQKISNSCYVAMQVVHGKWQRLAPASGFIC